ncbi:MAG: 3-isopropylmalate dehydratase small subunit [Frankiaceae bacterium]|jgi:3-isopropylmalate/(R)-2-methylmalate dehydratase small subunit
MEAFPSPYTGTAVPLRRSNVDTDQIIPASYLKRVSRTGFADGLFAAWRAEPGFVLDDPAYRGATILLAGPDFGTGSSREHAVWALQDAGFRVVISARFADIFRGNAYKGGLLPVQLDNAAVQQLMSLVETSPATPVTVDLAERAVRVEPTDGAAFSASFDIDDYAQWRLLEGLDDIELTLTAAADIAAFEATRPPFLPAALPIRG